MSHPVPAPHISSNIPFFLYSGAVGGDRDFLRKTEDCVYCMFRCSRVGLLLAGIAGIFEEDCVYCMF